MSERRIRRILVALDASANSLEALSAAVDLARRTRAELRGLFVEDTGLLRLALLPFAREVGAVSALGRPLDTEIVRRALRAQAQRARTALTRAAERVDLSWSFQVVQGEVTQEVIAATESVDVIALGMSGSMGTGLPAAGSTVAAVVARSSRSVLLLRRGRHLRQPVVLFYEGGPGAARALEQALGLARDGDGQLVLVLAGDPARCRRLRQECLDAAAEAGVEVRLRELPEADPRSVAEAVNAVPCGVLVLAGNSALLQGAGALAQLGRLRCPVFIVR